MAPSAHTVSHAAAASAARTRTTLKWRETAAAAAVAAAMVAVAAAEEKEAPTAVAAAATRRGGRTRWQRRAEGGAGRGSHLESPCTSDTTVCPRGIPRSGAVGACLTPEGSSAERAREVMTTSRRCSGATKPASGLAERSCSLVQPTVQESRPQTDSKETAPGKEHSIQYLWTDRRG